MIRSCEHYNDCRKPVIQCNSSCDRTLPNRVFYPHDIDELKRQKTEFINNLIAKNVSYNLCGEVSALLNKFIGSCEALTPETRDRFNKVLNRTELEPKETKSKDGK